ncbi:hypothetical protein PAESOLCIP111_06719 [Paenibacillus solanacearum]|uniref:Apea-like HEPN domain-containing protein n=1 Tax=Paenibacillus solanacearum TaxID=2048548 RepID=A0A916NM19_9BACL|nr:hypothetical protein [Paenibacillus solanacearum]CAG7653188.1 hypothetical protein PAESOLCIP111_06719 [Paenibacillus solanacearum]
MFNGSMHCRNCNNKLSLNFDFYKKYFEKHEIRCDLCQEIIDFEYEVKFLFDIYGSGHYYQLLGCNGLLNNAVILPNQPLRLDISEVIEQGRLMYISYTCVGTGGLVPVEHFGNEPMRYPRDNSIRIIYPCKFIGSDRAVGPTNINIIIWYAPKILLEDIPIMFMLDSFQSFYENNYRNMILTMQTPIEIEQNILFNYLKTNLLSFPQDMQNMTVEFTKTSYSKRQLSYLPLISKTLNMPSLDNAISSGLELLNKQRNMLVHEGRIDNNFSFDNAKECLISSFITVQYYRVIREYIFRVFH